MSFTPREMRSIIRKAIKRVPEGEEIRHLNIMPMMDMMTILLVAFIFQATVTATALTAGQVQLPRAMSEEEMPEGATTLIISRQAILVEGKSIVAVRDGDVDASEKEGGAFGLKIPRLSNYLAALRLEEKRLQETSGGDPDKVPELLIIADQSIPYGLLHRVLFSAKEKEAGYKRFRMIVQKHTPVR
jgi:biopolymer transport protein ExbD